MTDLCPMSQNGHMGHMLTSTTTTSHHFTWRVAMAERKRRRRTSGFMARKRRRTTRASNLYRPYIHRNLRLGGYLDKEIKYVDWEISGGNAVATALATAIVDPGAGNSALNAIAQGDAENERDGKKVICKSVYVRGELYGDIAAAAAAYITSPCVRVMCILDTQTNGAACTGTEVLDDNFTTKYLAPRELKYSERIKTLYDQMFVLEAKHIQDAAGTASIGTTRVPFAFYRKLDLPVTFSTTAGTTAAIVDCSLHMLAISNVATTNINFASRVRFVG